MQDNLKQNTLNHLAIIMDGNGRWAKNRALPRTDGHKEGAKVVREITKWCADNKIAYISLYAFSTENWLRPKSEVDFLMKLLEKYLKNEEHTYGENNIRFKAIGDISAFSPKLRDLIVALEQKTVQNTALTQILALNYGAKDEIARAILKMLKSRRECTNLSLQDESKGLARQSIDAHKSTTPSLRETQCESTTPSLRGESQIRRGNSQKNMDSRESIPKSKSAILAEFESALDTANIPPVDLLIRTGGEMRLSNFLLYQCAYAELYFSKTLFPDFNTAELTEIIANFKFRHRRFGEV